MTRHTVFYFILDKCSRKNKNIQKKKKKSLIANPQRSGQIPESEEKLINSITLLRFSHFIREELKKVRRKKTKCVTN